MVQLTVADYRSAIYGRYLQLKPKKGELESLVPSLTLWVVVATYVSCRIIAVIKGTYFGGLSWPFLSDTGRDPPASHVFLFGVCTASAAYFWSMVALYRRTTNWVDNARHQVGDRPPISSFLGPGGLASGILGSVSLMMVAAFNSFEYAAVFEMAGTGFFIGTALAMCCWTILFDQFHRMYPAYEPLATSRKLKVIFFGIFLLALVVYLPVGMLVTCPARQLSLKACFDITTSFSYCYDNELAEDPTLTDLWSYEDCPTSYTMKSVAQTLCILSMLFYSLTFGTDLSLCMETLHPWYGHGLRWESTSGEGRQFLSL